MTRRWQVWASLGAILLATSPIPCRGGGSLYVDDSATTPAGRCQLESWIRAFQSDTRETTAVPACSTGSWEWSVALTHLSARSRDLVSPGLKWNWLDNSHGGFGFAVAGTDLIRQGRQRDAQIYMAPSWVWGDAQQWELDGNAGINHQVGDRSKMLAGLGIEYTPVRALTLIAERLVKQGHGNDDQAGIRVNVDKLNSIDVFVGHSRDTFTDRGLTIGVNLGF
jgi:hypothetical protein